jgi:hypothetical protein
VRRWTTSEIVTGGASLVLLISLFTPWFRISFAGCPPLTAAICRPGVLRNLDGLTVHPYLWATLLPTAAVLTLLVLHAGLHPVPFTGRSAYRVLLPAAAAANFALVLVAFLAVPGYIALPRHPVGTAARPALDIGWDYGADLAVAAAVTGLAAAVLTAILARSYRSRAISQ